MRMTKIFLTLTGILGLTQAFATDNRPFFLEREDGTILEGYYSPPTISNSPIIFAIQGSSCESVQEWHNRLSTQVSALGLGVIVLEKQGISSGGINLPTYHQTNSLQNRLDDYVICLKNTQLICPGWEGKPIFWGESEGGMLACALAGQVSETAAVLLFGAGGGMKPREEVKWALHHHMEKQGIEEYSIGEYMNFLDRQMDEMILNPTSEQQFLGNTYRWWASFLAADEAMIPLTQHSVPVCLIHGVEDSQIPVLSADIAAERLSEKSVVTYLRLEGYGHNLDTIDVQDAVNRWLASILFGQESLDSNLIAQASFHASTALENTQSNPAEYIFRRGRDKDRDRDGDRDEDRGGRGAVYGGLDARGNSDGNGSVSADGGVRYHSDNGWDFGISGGGSISRDRNGNARGEVHGRAEASKEF